jgi:hypothetical protein
MKQLFKYVVIRFLPYGETDEFANIGILVFSPETGFFDFKLAPPIYNRITHFFKKLETNFYKNIISLFNEEFSTIKKIIQELPKQEFIYYMENMFTPKESVIQFSSVRSILVDNNKNIIEQLYNNYVIGNFLKQKENRETQMISTLRQQLIKKQLGKIYKETKIKTGIREVTLPLVAHHNTNETTKIIKPLAFNQHKPTLLIEHGERWLNRFNWLIKGGIIDAGNILLPIEPTIKEGVLKQAYLEVIKEIEANNITVIDFNDQDKILNFAKTALEFHSVSQGTLWH